MNKKRFIQDIKHFIQNRKNTLFKIKNALSDTGKFRSLY